MIQLSDLEIKKHSTIFSAAARAAAIHSFNLPSNQCSMARSAVRWSGYATVAQWSKPADYSANLMHVSWHIEIYSMQIAISSVSQSEKSAKLKWNCKQKFNIYLCNEIRTNWFNVLLLFMEHTHSNEI